MKHILASLTAAALVAVLPMSASSETLESETPACVGEKKIVNDCLTAVISERAPIAEVLKGIRSVKDFSSKNGFAKPLTGKEMVEKGKFVFAL